MDGLSLNVRSSGQPEKIVIVSCHPMLAFIVLWLRDLNMGHVAFYHANLSFKARRHLEDTFEERKIVDGKSLVDSDRPRFPVGIAGVMGVGQNLKRAAQIVLMEPHYLLRAECRPGFEWHRRLNVWNGTLIFFIDQTGDRYNTSRSDHNCGLLSLCEYTKNPYGHFSVLGRSSQERSVCWF